MGVQLLLLLGLGCHFKQAGDEGDLRTEVVLQKLAEKHDGRAASLLVELRLPLQTPEK
jgi:hypothetical protein